VKVDPRKAAATITGSIRAKWRLDLYVMPAAAAEPCHMHNHKQHMVLHSLGCYLQHRQSHCKLFELSLSALTFCVGHTPYAVGSCCPSSSHIIIADIICGVKYPHTVHHLQYMLQCIGW